MIRRDMTSAPKTFEYAVSVDRDGALRAEDDVPFAPTEAWTPEHLVLAGLARCTLKSLAFHAARAGTSAIASAEASGTVARREEDGRYAFAEILCGLDVTIDPAPEPEVLDELVARAERDCFVGASLRVTPEYEWRVNGELVPR
jgi:organic hydroperoxide reductase OsmC/OhrA